MGNAKPVQQGEDAPMYRKSMHAGSTGSGYRIEADPGGKSRRRAADLSMNDLHIAWNDLVPVPLSDEEEPLLVASGRHGKDPRRR